MLFRSAVATGAAAASSPLSLPRASSSATLGGQPMQVVFIGMTPGLVGLLQANLVVPDLPPGDHPLVVVIGGVESNRALVTVGFPR